MRERGCKVFGWFHSSGGCQHWNQNLKFVHFGVELLLWFVEVVGFG